MKKILLISSNPGKQNELRNLLVPTLSQYEIDLEACSLEIPEIQGTSDEIIIEKMRSASLMTSSAFICEDSSLSIHAWHDFPGPYMWFLCRKHVREAVGCGGLSLMLKSFQDKSACAECRIGFVSPGEDHVFFTGKVEGNIVEPRGSGGFGWDSLFEPQGHGLTYAEMTQELKDSVSDRAMAVQQFLSHLTIN